MPAIAYLVSCAHATCAVPEAQRELFKGAEEVLTSPEGWDPGALNLAQAFAMKLRTPLVHGNVTRLLVDLEKDEPACWSRFSVKLPDHTKQKLLERHSHAYQQTLRQRVATDLERHDKLAHLLVRTTAAAGDVVVRHEKGDAPGGALAASWARLLREKNIACRSEAGGSTPLHRAAREGAEGKPFQQVELLVPQSYFLENTPMRWITLRQLLVDTFPLAVKAG